MIIFIADDYAHLSKQVADDVARLMQLSLDPLICTASGDSPAGSYKEIVDRVLHQQLDVSGWNYVGLDEWVGLNGNDEGSCRYHLNNQLFHPLETADDKICFFDGRARDLSAECEEVENFIRQHQGLDIVIAGLGLNGHIGMNEPGTDPALHTHVADLDPITKKTGQKYFNKEQELSQGITLGLANFMEARHVFLLVSGRHKAAIVQQVLEGEISEKLPASLLRRHPGLNVYLDKEAASLLKEQ
jgi:glucosamine-6-phosphate isomerase